MGMYGWWYTGNLASLSEPNRGLKMELVDKNEVRIPVKSTEAIAPADLKKVWPSVREHVANMDAPDHAPVEEVYAMCFTNQATLFILKVDDYPIGHAIVRLTLPDLHLWQVYGKTGYDVLELFKPEMMELAKKVGATYITFGSSRMAWKKVGLELGFKPRMIVYEMVVE
jgi:hypothetical protein